MRRQAGGGGSPPTVNPSAAPNGLRETVPSVCTVTKAVCTGAKSLCTRVKSVCTGAKSVSIHLNSLGAALVIELPPIVTAPTAESRAAVGRTSGGTASAPGTLTISSTGFSEFQNSAGKRLR